MFLNEKSLPGTVAVLAAMALAAPSLAAPGGAAGSAPAGGAESAPPVKFALVSEASAVAPGRPFTVALHLVHRPGWHTYWKAPGDVGMPTMVEWQLPAGFAAGPVQWQHPEKVKMGPYTSYGYGGEALLLAEITPPADLEVGGEVELKADTRWLCCNKACHVGATPVALTLAVAAQPAADPAWQRKFDRVRADLPAPSPAWSAAARREGDRFVLTLSPREPGGAAAADLGEVYFFSYDNQVSSDAPQQVAVRDGTVVLTLVRPDFAPEKPTALSGIVYATGGWHAGGEHRTMEIGATHTHTPRPSK